MFVVFYSVKIVYICVYMTCSTSYCLCLYLQIHGMFVCLYVSIILVELINNNIKCMGIFRKEEKISKLGLNLELERDNSKWKSEVRLGVTSYKRRQIEE